MTAMHNIIEHLLLLMSSDDNERNIPINMKMRRMQYPSSFNIKEDVAISEAVDTVLTEPISDLINAIFILLIINEKKDALGL